MRKGNSRVHVLTVSSAGDGTALLLISGSFLLGAAAGHFTAGIHGAGWQSVAQAADFRTLSGSAGWEWLMTPVQMLLLSGILGFSALGVAGLPLLMFVQGFSTGCAASVMVRTWGYPGLKLACLWIGAGRLPLLAALVAVCSSGWTVARGILAGERTGRGTWPDFFFLWISMGTLALGGSAACRWLVSWLLARLGAGL